jgi:hypothetical protein
VLLTPHRGRVSGRVRGGRLYCAAPDTNANKKNAGAPQRFPLDDSDTLETYDALRAKARDLLSQAFGAFAKNIRKAHQRPD